MHPDTEMHPIEWDASNDGGSIPVSGCIRQEEMHPGIRMHPAGRDASLWYHDVENDEAGRILLR